MIKASVLLGTIVAGVAIDARDVSAQGAQTAVPGEAVDLPRRVAVRFLTESDHPPFNYLDDEGVLTGFNVDLARAICQDMSAACDIQVRPWADLIPALRKGDADALIASHVATPDLVREFTFTDRYFYTPGRFAIRRTGPRLVATPEGLEGRRIAVRRGSPHEAYLRAFFRDSPIQTFETGELAREALTGAGPIDLVFDDAVALSFWINGTLSRQCCELAGGPYFEPKYFGDGIGVLVQREDVQLRDLMNQALRRIRESGRYEELMLRYFPNRLF